jgi:hypothetical protein
MEPHLLDRMALPEIRIFGRRCSTFHVWGTIGLLASAALGYSLSLAARLSVDVMGILVFTSVLTFVVVALVTKVIIGEERLIYYHHELAILLAAALALFALDAPVLAYLDIVGLGLGTFLAFGRIGCFMVGCCYGRPARRGVCYGEHHARAGFPHRLCGTRLFPVQLVEAALTGAMVVYGLHLVEHGAPGTAFGWQTSFYAAFRSTLELIRGDRTRPYYRGLSEAQWTSGLLASATIAAELAGWVPRHELHLLLSGATLIGLSLLLLRHRRERPAPLPDHGHSLDRILIDRP